MPSLVFPCFYYHVYGALENGLQKAVESHYMAIPLQLPLLDDCEQVILVSYCFLELAESCGPLDLRYATCIIPLNINYYLIANLLSISYSKLYNKLIQKT